MLWCMAVTNGTTPKARALGMRLREARKAAGLTVRALAAQLEMSHSAISRWEGGSRSPDTEDVASYLTAVGVTGQERAELLELARGTNAPHWLSVQSGDRDRQMAALLDFERAATAITDVAPMVIPGLLQTADYTRAIMIAGEISPTEIETRVLVRVGRREVITRRKPASLLALVDETAVRRDIGGSDVMLDQLRHLLDVSELPNVRLQIMPAGSGWHPGLDGPFMVIEPADGPPIVHLENRRAGLFFHEPDDVKAYQLAVEKIRKLALSPTASAELIAGVISELETTQ